MKKTVAIIDFNAGNMFSVKLACEHVGLNAVLTQDPRVLLEADAAILPGVGAFGEAIGNLRALQLEDPIKEFVASRRPFMGVCLGMQLLFSHSTEFGDHKGLGLFEGQVLRFPQESGAHKIRVPQIGWNAITPMQKWQGTPLETVRPGEFMYFVHSFYVKPAQAGDALSNTVYEGIEYCSSVKKDNVVAFQFHPEKSGEEGVKIYQQWANQI